MKLLQLNTSWQRATLSWLMAQTSLVLRQVHDAALTSVTRKCPKLRSLDISGCQFVTPSAVTSAIDRCPSLRRLIAVNCRSLARPVNGVRGWDAIRKAKADMDVISRESNMAVLVCLLYHGYEVWFKLGEHTSLGKLMAAWCQRQKLRPWQVRFMFYGKLIDSTDTCASLGLEEGDVLDVFKGPINLDGWQALALEGR